MLSVHCHQHGHLLCFSSRYTPSPPHVYDLLYLRETRISRTLRQLWETCVFAGISLEAKAWGGFGRLLPPPAGSCPWRTASGHPCQSLRRMALLFKDNQLFYRFLNGIEGTWWIPEQTIVQNYNWDNKQPEWQIKQLKWQNSKFKWQNIQLRWQNVHLKEQNVQSLLQNIQFKWQNVETNKQNCWNNKYTIGVRGSLFPAQVTKQFKT